MSIIAQDLTGVRLYGFVTRNDTEDTVVGHVVDDGKASMPIHEWTDDCFSVSEAQHALRRLLGPHTDRFVWIENPEGNPITKAALERIEAERRPQPAPVPKPAPEMSPSETQAREHMCTVCAKRAVCIVADAVNRLASLHPTVVSCGGFEPPPPRDTEELLARLHDA